MLMTIVEIIILLLMLTITFAVAKRRRKSRLTHAGKVELSSTYCVNENGELEKLQKQITT